MPEKKKTTVHYAVPDGHAERPACSGNASYFDAALTHDRRKVTCENCKNSRAWKGKVGTGIFHDGMVRDIQP